MQHGNRSGCHKKKIVRVGRSRAQCVLILREQLLVYTRILFRQRFIIIIITVVINITIGI